MDKQRILIVDDERDIRELLTITLERMDLEVDAAGTVSDALAMLASRTYALCLTDMCLPDGSGQDLIGIIAEQHADLPVAMITAYGNVEAAVAALKAGAFDFVAKPVDIKVLRRLVETALKMGLPVAPEDTPTPSGEVPLSRQARKHLEDVDELRLVGSSPTMRTVRATIAKLARTQAPVHIRGESGVGKELAARLIHAQSPRADHPFIPVNCGAIPSELMESEFFGHVKGSFTGAHKTRDGFFQAADGGTLFLDEVAELPTTMQVKLLRAIQEKVVRRIGDHHETPVDIRILSATHKDIKRLVDEGAFRKDLYYRINVIALDLPPLRDHPEDIPDLAQTLLARIAGNNGQPPSTLSADAIATLQAYAFPGNVRELSNVLERTVAMCDHAVIDGPDVDIPDDTEPGARALGQSSRETGHAAATATPPSRSGQPLDDYISAIERRTIITALEKARYNKTEAARQLGISFRALRYKLKKYDID